MHSSTVKRSNQTPKQANTLILVKDNRATINQRLKNFSKIAITQYYMQRPKI
ncbi:MAG: hypothetical protein V7K40_13255 [Nostoc sp.]|uniref:hypothetical protein n=1 Tax=Nostoc sp. TaxID=1180 RepID=UPI002FF90262